MAKKLSALTATQEAAFEENAERRRELVRKIGVERVEWLEGPHATVKLSIPELQAEIARYKGLIKLAAKDLANEP